MPLDLKKANAPGSKRICGGRSLMRTDALVAGVGGGVGVGVARKRGLFCVFGCCIGV